MLTLTSKSDRTARYFLCQYVRDPFRHEPRNVGVIVQLRGELSTRFFGESVPGGKIDGRRLAAFGDPDNYQNWVHFWRRKLARQPTDVMQAVSVSGSSNFQVIDGGHISHPASESLEDVAGNLFSLLVLEDAFDDAVGLPAEERKSSPGLVREVASEFRRLDLFNGPFPSKMYRSRDLIGKSRPHRFEFLQVNGEGVPIEVFDFANSRPKTLERHVGWAKYAFSDVLEGPMKIARPTSIIRSEGGIAALDAPGFDTKYALDDLESVSELVDWASEQAKQKFLSERLVAAQHG